MIPIRDHNPSGKFPFITYFLIGLNVIVFLLMFFLSDPAFEDFIFRFSLIPVQVARGNNLFTFFTSIFLHGGIAHLISNMLFLNIFGDNLEDYFGHVRFLLFYFAAGIVASLAQFLVAINSTVPMVGASGAIAGVMGGYLVLFPRHRIDVLFSFGFTFRKASVPSYAMLFYWIVFQLLSGFGSLAYMSQVTGGVAYFAHIGGFFFGWLVTRLTNKRPLKSVIDF